MVSWPQELGDQLVGVSTRRQDVRIRTQMDTGPPKVRRRFTAAITRISVPLTLRGSQKQVFDDFYINDLVDGVTTFDWQDPTTDQTVSFRIGESGYPDFVLEVGGSPDDRIWRGVLDLEILP